MLGATVACSEEEPVNMPPSFNMKEVTNVLRTSATFSGSISGNTDQINGYGFQYSKSEEFSASLTEEVQVGEKPTSGFIEYTISGLEGGERYYYRMYATTGASKVYSPSEFFQTERSSAPKMSALEVDSIGENMARFNCTIEDIGDEYLIECGVSYRESGSTAWIPFASDSIVGNKFFVEVIGLEAATKYSFRPYAKNSADKTGEETGTREGYGATEEYTTEDQLSAVVETVEPVSGKIGMNSVEMSGRVLSAIGSNGVIDEVGFCYSQTNNTPNITDSHVTATLTKLNEYFTATVPDLSTATTYYVRAYAKNTVNGQERIGYGAVYEITTTDIATPHVEWVSTTDEWGNPIYDDKVTSSSISRKAKITNYDKGALVEKGFIWSTQYGDVTVDEAKKNGTYLIVDLESGGGNLIDGVISGLKASTGYHLRAYAIYQAAGMEEIGYTPAWSAHLSTNSIQYPDFSIQCVGNSLTSISFSMTIDRVGDGEIVEKGFLWKKSPEDGSWSDFTLEEGADGHLAFDGVSHETDTLTFTGLEIGTGYQVKGYVKFKVDGEIYTHNGGSTWGVGTQNLNLTIDEIQTSGTEISLIGRNYDDIEGITEYGFCWSTEEIEPSKMTNMIKASDPDENNQFKATIKELSSNTKYYLGVYAKIGDKVYYDDGRWDTTTKGLPTIDSNPSPSKKD